MAESIESLMVSLGLEVDKASFDRGLSQFRNLRGAAMLAGTAVGAAVGGAALVQKAAETRNALALQAEALGFSADEADRLGFALEQLGGSSDNAVNVLQQMRDLRDQAAYGEGALFDAGMFGIDAGPIVQAQDEMAALMNLSEQMQGLNETQRARAMDSLGFGGTGIQNLLRGGPDAFRAEMDRARELRELTDEQLTASNELIRATNEFSRALDGATDRLVERFAPAMSGVVDWATEVVSGDRPLIDLESPPKNGAVPGVGEFIDEMQRDTETPPSQEPQASANTRSSVLRDTEFRRAVAAAEREIGVPPGLLWAQMGQESSYDPTVVNEESGARGLAQMMPDTEKALEDRYFDGDDLDPFDRYDALKLQTELMRENLANAKGDVDEALRLYHGGYDRSQWGPINRAYPGDIRSRMENPQSSVNVNVGTIRVDGARDPQATGRAVREEIRRLADTAATDHRNPVV